MVCKYCGEQAGFLKSEHPECVKKSSEAKDELSNAVADAIDRKLPADEATLAFARIQDRGKFSAADAQHIILRAVSAKTYSMSKDEPASNEQLEAVYNIVVAVDPAFFQPDSLADRIKRYPGYSALNFSNTIWQVLHNEIPYFPEGQLPYILHPGETGIVSRSAQLAEYKTIQTGGGYSGVSVPIGMGMYYRLGTSHPRSSQTGLVPTDQGNMTLTTQAIWFGGQNGTFRIPYSFILRLEPFIDGVGVHEGYGRGQVFIPATLGYDDGYLWHNLLQALCKAGW